MFNKVFEAYKISKNRLFLLDYDGTMVGFKDDPATSLPDKDLLKILEDLSSQKANTVFFISGRCKNFLEDNFGHLNISFVAEHSALIKTPTTKWEKILEVDDSWVNDLAKIMRKYVKNTPNTVMEKKSLSVVWHYKGADKNIIEQRYSALKVELQKSIAKKQLIIAEGPCMLEVRSKFLSKHEGAKKVLEGKNYDFIFSAGDDVADEEMFKALPKSAYTLKVGDQKTDAKYALPNYEEFRKFLNIFN